MVKHRTAVAALIVVVSLALAGVRPAAEIGRDPSRVAAAGTGARFGSAALNEEAVKALVDATLAGMSLDEKVGQVIIPATVGEFLRQDSDEFKEIRRNIVEFHVGGYHLLGDVNQVHDPAGAALLVNHMQKLARVPLFITADFEGGAGYRFEGATRLPRGMALGATNNEDFSYQAGKITAEEARALGVNVNFYPVVDVNNNPRNPIINIRSFGSDPGLVSRMAVAYIHGSQDAGVMATAKHFPGHGDTTTDSHLELPKIGADRARLDQIELPPFRAAISGGVGGVMGAHISLPQIDPSGLPATLSPKLLTGLLRDDLNFQGVIFTDAMMMQGITAHYSEAEASVRALRAGADVILYPPNVEKAFLGIKHSVEAGDVTTVRLDESVRRILTAKARLHLDKDRFVDLDKVDVALGNTEHSELARRMMESAVTLVRNEGGVIPIGLSPEQKVLYISMLDNGMGWQGGTPGSTFLDGLVKRHSATTAAVVSDQTSPGQFDLVRKLAQLADVVIVAAFVRVAAYKGSVAMTGGEIDLLKALSSLKKPFAFVMFGSPYLISFVPDLPTYVLTYEYYPGAEDAALKAVLGEIPFRGRLPIELPGMYPLGYSAPGSVR